MKNKFLFKIGVFCGLLTLAVGLIIFFTWWIARALFAIDLRDLEFYGFVWSMASFPIATIGLLLVIFVLIRNSPQYILMILGGLVLILINLPIFYGVLIWQGKIEERAYVKIYNKTNIDNIELTLKASEYTKSLGFIDDNEAIVDYYYPEYIDERGNDSYPTIELVTLIIKDKFGIHYLKMPLLDKGQCDKIYIDKDFKLLDSWE